MATLTFNGVEYAVDRAVKGTDYVHGYSADGACIVSIEGIADFSLIVYDGDYLSPSACAEEPRNEVVYVDGTLQTKSGTKVRSPYAPTSGISTNYTIKSSDGGLFIWINSSSAVTITVPTHETVPLPTGTEIEFCKWGSGAVKFSPASGVTLNSVGNARSISDQYGCAVLKKLNTNLWLLAGALG